MTKINNAIAESISNSTRPTISIKAPDIYSITALIASPDAAQSHSVRAGTSTARPTMATTFR